MSASITRRSFLRMAGAWLAGAAACMLAGRPVAEPVRSMSAGQVRRRISSLFSSPRSATVVGASYLLEHPHRTRLDVLLEDARIDCTAQTSDEALAAAFAEARHADFAEGRVVLVNGWVLAQSEAACCALLATLSRSA